MTFTSLPLGAFALLCFSFLPVSRAWGQTLATTAENSNLAAGTIRQAIATGQARIAGHPREAQNYIDLAYTLVDAGLAEQAIVQMRRAVEVAPQSASVYHSQGWVLTHNSIGVQYGKGFDYDGALAAYLKASTLDPADLSTRESLAELYTYNRNGIRYASDARMDESNDILRFVKAHQNDKNEFPDVEDNLLIGLFYAGHFAEVLPELQGFKGSSKRDGVALAAIAALNGSALALERANQTADEEKRKDALIFAAEGLWNMRLYPKAADLLTASLPDPSGTNRLLGQIQIFKNLKPYRGADLPDIDPRSPVQRLIIAAVTDTLTDAIMEQCVSLHAFANGEERRRSITGNDFLAGKLHTLSRKTGLPQVVIQDMILNLIQLTMTPEKGGGAQVVMQAAGIASVGFFVLKEDGSYKIVSDDRANTVGREALYLIKNQQQEAATALLDWKRSLTERSEGGDPLSGPLFARLWAVGKPHSRQEIEVASASLVTDKALLLDTLPVVLKARKASTSRRDWDNLDLLLTETYVQTGDSANATRMAEQLLTRQPNSLTAVSLAGHAYALTKNWRAWTKLLDRQMKQGQPSRLLLLQIAEEAEAEGDFTKARTALRSLLDGGSANPDDYNTYAWLALFEDKIDDQALQASQQANFATQNQNAAYLHTFACLEAAQGNTAVARQFLLDAMAAGGEEEPNGSMWYGFGRIFEQYGVIQAAREAYLRVEAPRTPEPTSAYTLAQLRLKVLAAK